MMSTIVETVRTLLDQGMSAPGLARAAGLPANALRGAERPSWAPTREIAATLDIYLRRREVGLALATPEEIIDEARNGRMFILIDDEDRENEGDLVIPAQMATPNAINFMAQFGRGLICLALTAGRVSELGIPAMSSRNGTRHKTAFTVSIEAREGVSTGISVADRARTIAVAIDSARGASDVVTPGHVFPLVAREGGVLVRAGHTEAAVDVARLAGLNPSGVICEIMNDDGSMARLTDLLAFARKHALKIGTIRDLIAYRRRHDHLVEKCSETRFTSQWGGEWKAIAFRNRATGSEQLVLQKGEIDQERPTLVRMHVLTPLSDLFGRLGPRFGLLRRAMETIDAEGAGIIVALEPMEQDGSGSMLGDVCSTEPMPSETKGRLREYGEGAQLLAELGVHDMILLTNTEQSLIALDGYCLTVVARRPFDETIEQRND